MVIIPYVEVGDKVRKKVGGCHVLFSVTHIVSKSERCEILKRKKKKKKRIGIKYSALKYFLLGI